jgi:hypothetical protein
MALENETVTVTIMPAIRGHVTPRGVIEPRGTLRIPTTYSAIQANPSGYFFRLQSNEYLLEVGLMEASFYLKRNDYLLQHQLSPICSPSDRIIFFAIWDIDQIRTVVIDANTVPPGQELTPEIVIENTRILMTPPTRPPDSLLRWARRHELVPRPGYRSPGEFFEAVASSIESLADKIYTTGAQNPFWDMLYDGRKIANRQPKRETHIQQTIHALLYDQAIAKNFEIIPEAPVAGGRLDFSIIGFLTDNGPVKACVEFKYAHSDAIEHGLTDQLPLYMRGNGSDFGIYCVLCFKGEYFDEPDKDNFQIRADLENIRGKHALKNIRVIILDVGYHPPPSAIVKSEALRNY